MPTIIFDTTEEIPEHLRESATKRDDGKFEMNAKGVLDKNKELLDKYVPLKNAHDKLTTQYANLEAENGELKSKTPAVPHGQRIVSKEIAELGETAKNAALTKDAIPLLKTKVDDFERSAAREARNALRAKAAAAIGLDAEKFKAVAADTDFDLQVETVRENGADVEKFFVAAGDDKKPFKDFVESHQTFSVVMDSLKPNSSPKPRVAPFPVKEGGAVSNIYERTREEVKTKHAQPTADIDARFGRPNSF